MTILASSLTLANADYTWRSEAICRDTDPELLFPVGTTGYALLQIARAKEVCGQCPVHRDCLDYALETNQDSGIWGGTSEEERRVLSQTTCRPFSRERDGMVIGEGGGVVVLETLESARVRGAEAHCHWSKIDRARVVLPLR